MQLPGVQLMLCKVHVLHYRFEGAPIGWGMHADHVDEKTCQMSVVVLRSDYLSNKGKWQACRAVHFQSGALAPRLS
jgi:hypothetical protein